jgi:hypothetical protein
MNSRLTKFITVMFVMILATTIRADWTTYRDNQARTGYYGGASALSVPMQYAAGDNHDALVVYNIFRTLKTSRVF